MANAFDALSTNEKQQQFNEFFLIKHKLNVNVLPVEKHQVPALADLEDKMPYAFKIAGELASIEAQALRPLRNLSSHAAELAQFLNAQARKIDLMMSYILHQQDEESLRFESLRFGGGGIEVKSNQSMAIGTTAELRIFLTEEASAVFCYAEVLSCEPYDIEPSAIDSDDTQDDNADDNTPKFKVAFIYSRIRDTDQELLVRASLHLQAQQLRKRSESNHKQ